MMTATSPPIGALPAWSVLNETLQARLFLAGCVFSAPLQASPIANTTNNSSHYRSEQFAGDLAFMVNSQ